MKILAFGASNSNQSINSLLAHYTAELIVDAEVELLKINDYEMPIFSLEREQQLGQPEFAKQFFEKIGNSDGLVISFAEHNGTYTAAYKNLFDWASRIDSKVFQNKPMILLSAAPGKGGAASVLATAVESAPFYGADVKASVSVPSFFENFDIKNNQIVNHQLSNKLADAIKSFTQNK
jgi:NAD(P)H-dependent FMN reductase